MSHDLAIFTLGIWTLIGWSRDRGHPTGPKGRIQCSAKQDVPDDAVVMIIEGQSLNCVLKP